MHRASLSSFFALSLLATSSFAGQPLGQELRGGGSVVVGEEHARLEHQGMNDSMILIDEADGLPHDRWFTSSTQVRGRFAVDTPLTMPHRAFWTTSLGLNMYTPRDPGIATVAALDGDRPYSGWLAGSFGGELVVASAPIAIVRTAQAFTHVGVEVFGGTRGPWSFAGPAQHFAHDGWRLRDGGELPPIVGWGVAETAGGVAVDVDAFADTSVIAFAIPNSPTLFGAQPTLHVRAGVRGDVGLMLDAAAVNSTVMLGFMHDAVTPHTQGTTPFALYVAVRPELRAVLFNETIDGVLVDGSRAAQSTPMVAEVVTALVARVWIVEASVNAVYRSNEIASLSEALAAQTSPSVSAGQWFWQWSAAAVW